MSDSDRYYEQEVAAHEETKAQRDAMIRAVRGVVACFKSIVGGCDDVGCINDHHPSCLQYLESILKKVGS